jgi:hypothetical protein
LSRFDRRDEAVTPFRAVTNNTNVIVEPQKKKLHASRREALAWGLAPLFLSAAISVWLLHSSVPGTDLAAEDVF